MNTEITDKEAFGGQGWICYDAGCDLCVRWAERVRAVLEGRGFVVRPLQDAAVRARLKVTERELLREMRVITPEGKVYGGGDAVLFLAKTVPAARPIHLLGLLPGGRPFIRAIYRWIADKRGCHVGACGIPAARSGVMVWTPLALCTAVAFALEAVMPAWAWMWTICFALFFGCKWAVVVIAAKKVRIQFWHGLGFVLLWPGMDAERFFRPGWRPQHVPAARWVFSVAKVVAGIALIWGVVPGLLDRPMVAGWIGMLGFMLLVHFGFFELLAWFWKARGIDVVPLMVRPLTAHGVVEFWGRRWNTGFHALAERFVFKPLLRRVGVRGATLAVFAASGLVHDLVISVPARSGYGLPTLYFVIQGAAVLFEKTTTARRWGAGRGWRGWLFTVTVTAGPAFWLFHPEFIRKVIVPFFKTLNGVGP